TIPLVVLGGLLVGHLVQIEGIASLAGPLYRLVPGATAELIRKELAEIAEAEATSVAPLSVLGFLWLTSNGFHNLMDVFELLIGARPRSWIRQRAIAMAWVISSLLAICISVWFLLVTTGWIDKFEAAAHHPHLLRRVRS